MPRRITITIPYPAAELNPNARVNFMKKASAQKRYRLDCGIAIKAAMNRARFCGGPFRAATVTPKFYPTGRQRTRDRDNALASLKAAFDALQDAGLVENDSGLTYLPVEFYEATDRRVELVIEERIETGGAGTFRLQAARRTTITKAQCFGAPELFVPAEQLSQAVRKEIQQNGALPCEGYGTPGHWCEECRFGKVNAPEDE